MDNDNVKFTEPDGIIKRLNDLLEHARNSKQNMDDLDDRLNEIENLLAENDRNYKDYVNFFSMVLQDLKEQSGHDRDLKPMPSRVLALSEKLSRMQAELEKASNDLNAREDAFRQNQNEMEKTMAKMREECQAEIDKERDALLQNLTAKKEELAKIKQEIQQAQEQLEELKQNMEQFGSPAATAHPSGDRPEDMQKVLDEFDKEGFSAPSDTQYGHLYLCSQFSNVDVTFHPAVIRDQLLELDPDEFNSTGKPQITFRQQNGEWVVLPNEKLKNQMNGKEITEETPVPQGAVIVMTDKRGEKHTVKVLIGKW